MKTIQLDQLRSASVEIAHLEYFGLPDGSSVHQADEFNCRLNAKQSELTKLDRRLIRARLKQTMSVEFIGST